MSNDKNYKKIVLHISEELNERMEKASAKNKLSIGSIVREAINRYLDDSEKKSPK
jgi:predicted DNA-binding protein